MKILFKYATRGRPVWFRSTLALYYNMVSADCDFEFVITLDKDDKLMNTPDMRAFMDRIKNLKYYYGTHKNKIEAINDNLDGLDYDILFIVSDDMIPQVNGFDKIIVDDMKKNFPDTDGALHYHDGFCGKDNTITLSIMGRKLYDQIGYVYHPDYWSLYCDNEFTDVVRKLNKYFYNPRVIVKHNWHGGAKADATYRASNASSKHDEDVYNKRKALGFPSLSKVISFVLFDVDVKHHKDQYSYWENVPYILIAFSEIYKDFILKFYVHTNSVGHKIFKLLKLASEINNNIQIETVSDESINTKLTVWRMKPLWDNIDYLFCRDIDYTITRVERESVEFFLKSDKLIHGIRSYKLHTAPIMAGLCGFKVRKVRDRVKDKFKSFQEYVDWGHGHLSYCSDWRWGCDQALLRELFNTNELDKYILDCPQYTAAHLSSIKTKPISTSEYANIDIQNCNLEMLNYSDSLCERFTGAPYICTRDQIERAINLVNNDLTKVIKGFYV